MSIAETRGTINSPQLGDPCCMSYFSKFGCCLWKFADNKWQLTKVTSANGGVPSDPPHHKGKFEGEIRSTPCAPPA